MPARTHISLCRSNIPFLNIQAIEYFQKLLHDLDIICSFPLDPLFEGVLNFVTEFQKLQPDLVARAHLQVSSTSHIVEACVLASSFG